MATHARSVRTIVRAGRDVIPAPTRGGRVQITLGAPRDPILLVAVGAATNSFAAGQAWVVGGAAALVARAAQVTGNAASSAKANAFEATLSAPALSAFGGASALLTSPKLSLSITGTVQGLGSATLTAPAIRIAAAGAAGGAGGAALIFGDIRGTYSIVGYSGSVLATTIGEVTVRASGVSGALGAAALTLPLYELQAAGTTRGVSRGSLLIPAARLGATAQAWLVAPGATLVAVGTATVAATYEAYCVNLNHKPRPGSAPIDETTRYTNFPFDRIVRFKNSYFGVAADGLYLLEGTTDFATPAPTAIPWAWRTGVTDFGSTFQKTVESIYFSGRLGAATVSVYAGESAANAYSYPEPSTTATRNHRQTLGRGLKSRYYAFGAAGTGVMELDDIDFSVGKHTRKI